MVCTMRCKIPSAHDRLGFHKENIVSEQLMGKLCVYGTTVNALGFLVAPALRAPIRFSTAPIALCVN